MPRNSLSRLALVALIASLAWPAAASADDGWQAAFEPALAEAKKAHKPMVVDMWASWCSPCLKFAKVTLPDDGVKARLAGFVTVKVDMDAPENEGLWKRYGVKDLPRVFFLTSEGEAITALTMTAFETPAEFSARLDRARAHFKLPPVAGGAVAKRPAEKPTPEAAPEQPAGEHAAGRGDSAKPATGAFAGLPASAVAEKPSVVARLITDVDALIPGQEITAGVHLDVEPGWHVYWRYPGDAGRATQVRWTVPEGVEQGPLRWPAPLKFTEQNGTLTTYGYEREQLLSQSLKVPDSVEVGAAVDLKADVEWLVCREKCIPGRASLTRSLPVAATAAAAPAAAVLARPSQLQITPVADHPHWSAKIDYEGVPLKPEGIARGHIVLTYSGDEAPLALASGPHVVPFVPDGGRHFKFVDVAYDVGEESIRVDFSVQAGELAPEDGATALGGIIRVKAGDEEAALQVVSQVSHGPVVASSETPPPAVALPEPVQTHTPLWEMLLYAFIGGLLLNIMPCVLPVLSIKVLSLVHQAGESKTRVLQHGLMYTLGVLVSFWALAAIVILLKASGDLVGWGFQFQNPWFVVSLTALIFGFGLSMFGVFEVSLPGMQVAANAGAKGGMSGSFTNGAFATLLATPCTAPFLGPAMGYAFTQTSSTIVLFFTTVALGLAAPFLLLARFPNWTKKIPRPGPWMETFKQVMGFLLMGTVIWLVDVLSQQVSRDSVTRVLIFLGVVAVASWIYGRFGNFAATAKRRWIATLAALGMIVLGGKAALQLTPASAEMAAPGEGDIAWQPFSPEAVAAHQAAGRTVFIDFTAAWCVTCKVNENTVIETDEIKAVLDELGVATLKGDYTNEDPVIAEWLRRFKRVGVPLYVVIPGADPKNTIVLPEILTHSMLEEALRKAGPSKRKMASKG